MKLSGRRDNGQELTPQEARELAAALVEQMRDNWAPADQAMVDMVESLATNDPLRAQLLMRGAQVNATLAHREAVLELKATIREVSGRLVDSQGELTAKLREVA